MSDNPPPPSKTAQSAQKPAKDAVNPREARLKAALKANMARRKAQAKARTRADKTE